jgi:hypothetical protein
VAAMAKPAPSMIPKTVYCRKSLTSSPPLSHHTLRDTAKVLSSPAA